MKAGRIWPVQSSTQHLLQCADLAWCAFCSGCLKIVVTFRVTPTTVAAAAPANQSYSGFFLPQNQRLLQYLLVNDAPISSVKSVQQPSQQHHKESHECERSLTGTPDILYCLYWLYLLTNNWIVIIITESTSVTTLCRLHRFERSVDCC